MCVLARQGLNFSERADDGENLQSEVKFCLKYIKINIFLVSPRKHRRDIFNEYSQHALKYHYFLVEKKQNFLVNTRRRVDVAAMPSRMEVFRSLSVCWVISGCFICIISSYLYA